MSTTACFKVDMRQMYLLKVRPVFCKNGKTNRLLKDALCPSVGSYGVFYIDTKGNGFNMNYYSSEILDELRSGNIGRVRSVHKNSNITNTDKTYKYKNDVITECRYAECLIDFGNGIKNMKIGSPFSLKDGLLALNDFNILNAVAHLADVSPYEMETLRNQMSEEDGMAYRKALVINTDYFDDNDDKGELFRR